MLWRDFLEPMGLTAYRLAKDIGMTPSAIGDIIARRRSVTAETALKLARYFGTSPDVWLGLQMGFDLETAQDRIAAALEAITPRDPGAAWGRSGAGPKGRAHFATLRLPIRPVRPARCALVCKNMGTVAAIGVVLTGPGFPTGIQGVMGRCNPQTIRPAR